MLEGKVRWIPRTSADPAQMANAAPPPQPVPHPNIIWPQRSRDASEPPPPAPAALRCPDCGHRDTGPMCRQCGGVMGPPLSPMHALLDHVVVERLVDLLAVVKTSWLMLTGPVSFFRAVLQQHSTLADRDFFLSWLWARLSPRPQKVLNPVRYVILVSGIAVFMQWLAGVESELQLPDWGVEIGVVLFMATYSFVLSLMLGGRIATADLTRFALYYNGAVNLVTGTLLSFAGTDAGILLALAVLLLLGIGVPFVVLPALFPVTRTRLFLANVGVGVMAVGVVVLFAMAVELMAGSAASPDTFAPDSAPAVEADTFALS